MAAVQQTEFSVSEAARQLGFSVQYVYSLVYSGKLRAPRVAGKWRIPSAELIERRKRMESRNGER